MIGFKHAYYISAFLYLCTIFFVLQLKEPIVTEKQKRRESQTERELWNRWKKHIEETGSFIKKHPKTMKKLLADAALACPCYLIMMYLQEHLVNCGWLKRFIGIPMLLIPLTGALGTRIAVRNTGRLSKVLFICGIVSGVGTCLVGSNALVVIICGACIVQGCEGFAEILVSENVNRDFTSDHRATVYIGKMKTAVVRRSIPTTAVFIYVFFSDRQLNQKNMVKNLGLSCIIQHMAIFLCEV